MSELTHDELKEYLSYDKDTGLFTWLVNKGRAKAGSIAGSNTSDGYRQLKFKGVQYLLHRLAWFYVYGEWPKQLIDPINRIKNDNRIINLRDVSNRENCSNSNSNNTIIGAIFIKDCVDTKPWKSSIKYLGKAIHLGYFETSTEAGQAYLQALNSINTGGTLAPPKPATESKWYSFSKSKNKWIAYTKSIKGVRKDLGYFNTEQEAIDAVANQKV